MKKFNNITDFIKDFESFTPVAKINQIDGHWELGYGQTGEFLGHKIVEGMTCTKNGATEQLNIELHSIWQYLIDKDIHLGVFQTHAVISLLYNIGRKGAPRLLSFCDSDELKASHEFLNEIYSNGKPILGLLRRRISEYRIFTLGFYERFEEGDKITPDELRLLLKMNSGNKVAVRMIKELPVQ